MRFRDLPNPAQAFSHIRNIVLALTMLATTFAQASVAFNVTNSWATGFNGQITITNDATNAVIGWTLEFDFPGTITNLWNGTITSHVGTHYRVHDAGYNATIAAGGNAQVGFTADPATTSQPPANYIFNGVASGTALTIATTSLPGATLGGAYSEKLAAGGGTAPYTWSVTAGGLPASLALSETGVLSGIPTAEGTSYFTLQVSDSSVPPNTTTRSLSIAVAAPPAIAISDASVTITASGGPSFFSTMGNQIVDAAGNPVRITGINWFGFETSNGIAHGLWTRSYKSILDQIKALGFNTLRLPFSNAMLRAGATTNSINFNVNPDLQGLTPLQCLDKIVDYCGQIGLRVLLDRHSAKADGYLNEDVWFIAGDGYYTEQRWIDDWVMLATHFMGNPTVVGADLFNEPKRIATWGNTSPATDWNKAAERCGNAILAANPDWLIIVEGVQSFAGDSYWWGGNLKGVAAYPVNLNVAHKLVYSIHDYPASVSAQPWFSAANYPQNLAALWDSHWGYIFKSSTAPMLLGEFGSKLATVSDQQWLSRLTQYVDGDFDFNSTSDLALGSKGISWTFWCFNPDSGDTGGIVGDDWTTVNTAKLGYIQASMAPLLSSTSAAQTAVFAVNLSRAAVSNVTVQWTTLDGTALAGTDYIAAGGILTFAPGEMSKTITVSLLPTAAPAGTKNFSVQLSNVSGGTIADNTGVATIVDSNTPPTPWQKWCALYFTPAQLADPLISGELADPMNKGRSNIVEYALGNAPTAPGIPPGVRISGDRLMLAFTRNTAATDVNLLVQAAESPAGPWTNLAQSSGGAAMVALFGNVPVVETGNTPVRNVEVGDMYLSSDIGHLRRFMRILVSH